MKRTNIAAIALVLAFAGSQINAGRADIIRDEFVAKGEQIVSDMDELRAKAVKEHEEANAKFKRVTTAIDEAQRTAKGYINNVVTRLSNTSTITDEHLVKNKKYLADSNGYVEAKHAAEAAHKAHRQAHRE